jgi:choline-phosphate cytidylyltransferase
MSVQLLTKEYMVCSNNIYTVPVNPAFAPSSHTTPMTEQLNFMPLQRAAQPETNHPVFISPPFYANASLEEHTPSALAVAAFNPATLSPEDIQLFVRKAIEGESFRKYKINQPPTGRPVRVHVNGLFIYLLLLRH